MTKAMLIFLAVLATGTVSAADSLARGIPSDYMIYLRRRANPRREFLRPDLDALGKSLRQAVPADDAADLALALFGRKTEGSGGFRRLFVSVPWERLFAREWALGIRFDLVVPEGAALESATHGDWLALFRVDPSERNEFLLSVRKLFYSLDTLRDPARGEPSGSPSVIEGERDGVPTTILVENGQVALVAGGQDDVVALSSS